MHNSFNTLTELNVVFVWILSNLICYICLKCALYITSFQESVKTLQNELDEANNKSINNINEEQHKLEQVIRRLVVVVCPTGLAYILTNVNVYRPLSITLMRKSGF